MANINSVKDVMMRYELSDGVNIFFVNYQGEVILPENYETSENWSQLFEEVTDKMGAWERDKYVIFSSSQTLCYSSCVNYGNRPYYIIVRYPLTIAFQAVQNMQMYVLIIGACAIVVGTFCSYLVANGISRPIRSISQTAQKLGKGDYSAKFENVEYAEVAQLSDTLNYVTGEIKKSDDFQKQLLANVSHDFKTPLTMIKAYASMIQEISGDDKQKRQKHLQVIIDETDRLTGLVNDVLAASKISAGLEQLNKKVFNLTEFIYGILDKFGYLQETQGYTFMIDIDPDMYTLADEEKIGQVIYNLISNAVNYTGEDKHIFVSLKDIPQENRIKFSVRDTGKGIGKEELEHIWDRYYRTNDSHIRPVKGTGLGLNIVKVILNSHAFDFGVNSVEGEGSTFYVDFPSVSSVPEGE
jgi:signal transduction histidine kinase